MTMLIDDQIRRFAPVSLAVDLDGLPASERRALGPLVRAARIMDAIFLEQVWAGNTRLLLQLAADDAPAARTALRYFVMNKGPWSRLDDDEPFVAGAGVPPKPPQANFYPADATKAEIERWIASLDPAARAEATGFFSVIGRNRHGALASVPYAVEYRQALLAAAAELSRAAALTAEPSLRAFLDRRAAAFLSNDYYDSDVAWMALDSAIEPTIGPYETYEDGWFGYKAAFEAFITVRDDAETGKLANVGRELQRLEDTLPIDPAYRNPALGGLAPIRVVNLVFAAGDGNRGVQTAAFNLPNDERVLREKGAKRVMLKNVQDAKFRRVLEPIARVVLAPADAARVSFDAFFAHILLHELMHGLGPHAVGASGVPVRLALKDTYAAIEEAKADISGLWALQQLVDRGVVGATIGHSMYVTFLASTFRSIRFGLNEAHGRGIALQLNTLLDEGAVRAAADGTFSVDDLAMRRAVEALTTRVMTIQARGDYAAAATLLDRMVAIRPEVQRALDAIGDVPIDIAPDFATARKIDGATQPSVIG